MAIWGSTVPTSEGGAILPTLANPIDGTYTNNALGQLSQDASPAINGGSIHAGSFRTAGTWRSSRQVQIMAV